MMFEFVSCFHAKVVEPTWIGHRTLLILKFSSLGDAHENAVVCPKIDLSVFSRKCCKILIGLHQHTRG